MSVGSDEENNLNQVETDDETELVDNNNTDTEDEIEIDNLEEKMFNSTRDKLRKF